MTGDRDSEPASLFFCLCWVQERFGKLDGLTFTWVGDGNNVLHDLMLGAAKLGKADLLVVVVVVVVLVMLS